MVKRNADGTGVVPMQPAADVARPANVHSAPVVETFWSGANGAWWRQRRKLLMAETLAA